MSVKHDITTEGLERVGFRALHAGDDYDYSFAVTRGGVVLGLTGSKIWFTVKEDSKLDDTKAKLQIDSDGADITITDGPAGKFTVHFRDTDTAGLEGIWPYDIKVRLGGSGSEIVRLARGKIEFLPNLTRTIS